MNKKQPNILLIMTDQHRFDCLGCHGHPLVKTPNIDKFANNGVDFQRAYSQSAICMPSRLSVFTGQYLHTHGIQANQKTIDINHLTTLPNILKEHGYQTAAIGKTHSGPSDKLGFEYFRICAGTHADETNDYNEYLKANNLSCQPGNNYKSYDAFTSNIPYKHSVETWTGNECIDYLNKRDLKTPFFLWATFERPHAPTSVPHDNPFPYNPNDVELEEYNETWYTKPETTRPGCENMWNVYNTGEDKLRQAIANYLSLISMIDDQVGRIIDKIEASGQLEDTIIIFTADHGEFCGKYGQFGKNTSTFDVLYRVPFIWYQKGVTDKERVTELVELIDTMPTILDLAGIDCPNSVQGDSFAAVFNGSSKRCGTPWDAKNAVFFETPFVKTVRTQTHKLSYYFKESRSWGQLYDMAKDPDELENLYGRPEIVHIQRELETELLNWFIKTQQPQVHTVGDTETAPPWRWYQ
jgi:arylsulfatase A-like enzyme